jgi:hypothetical protein
VPPHDPPPPPLVTQGPHEIARHALGPKEPVNGVRIDPEEERRRLVALQFEAQRLAKKLGLEQHMAQPFPVDAPTSPEAAAITKEATPLMQQADAGAMLVYEKVKRTNAMTGEEVEATRVQFNVFAPVTKALEQLAKFVTGTLKGKFSLNAKVGKQGAEVSVSAEGKQE